MLQQHSQAAHAQPFSKNVDPKFFVHTFLGGGFQPPKPPSDYGPAYWEGAQPLPLPKPHPFDRPHIPSPLNNSISPSTWGCGLVDETLATSLQSIDFYLISALQILAALITA